MQALPWSANTTAPNVLTHREVGRLSRAVPGAPSRAPGLPSCPATTCQMPAWGGMGHEATSSKAQLGAAEDGGRAAGSGRAGEPGRAAACTAALQANATVLKEAGLSPKATTRVPHVPTQPIGYPPVCTHV